MSERVVDRGGSTALAYNNICFVKCHTVNNRPVAWFVLLRGNGFRYFHFATKAGLTDSSVMYKFSDLPASVRAFMSDHSPSLFSCYSDTCPEACHGKLMKTYIYR